MENNRANRTGHFNGATPLKRVYNRVYDEIQGLKAEIKTSQDRLELLTDVLKGLHSQITLDEKGKAVSTRRAENPTRVRALDFSQYLKPELVGPSLEQIAVDTIETFGPDGCLNLSILARSIALPETKAIEATYRNLRRVVNTSDKILIVGNKLFVGQEDWAKGNTL